MEELFKDVVSAALPLLGSYLGGPLGQEAAKIISTIITGKEDSDPKDICDCLHSCDSNRLVDLQRLDYHYGNEISQRST